MIKRAKGLESNNIAYHVGSNS